MAAGLASLGALMFVTVWSSGAFAQTDAAKDEVIRADEVDHRHSDFSDQENVRVLG